MREMTEPARAAMISDLVDQRVAGDLPQMGIHELLLRQDAPALVADNGDVVLVGNIAPDGTIYLGR
jgi:hypothetical protein